MKFEIRREDVVRRGSELVYVGPPIPAGVTELSVESSIPSLRLPALTATEGLNCEGRTALEFAGPLVVMGACRLGGNVSAERVTVFGDLITSGDVRSHSTIFVAANLSAVSAHAGDTISVGGAISTRRSCHAARAIKARSADASWSLSTHDLACEHVSVGLHLKVTGQVQVKTLKPGFGVVRAPGWSPPSPAATDQASPIPA